MVYSKHTYDEMVTLVEVVNTTNAVGDPVRQEGANIVVYASKKSVKMSEHYQAMVTGMKPEVVLVLRREEYGGQEKVRYQDENYRVLRTYETGEDIELVLEREVHRNGGT